MVAVIVGGRKEERAQASELMRRYWGENERKLPIKIASYASSERFLQIFPPGRVHLALLFSTVNGYNGLQTAFEIRKKDWKICLILIEEDSQYAVEGYLAGVCGYLLKPLAYEHFFRVMQVAHRNFRNDLDFIMLVSDQKQMRVLVHEIVYCDICGHYVGIHLSEGKTLRVRMTFEKLYGLLEGYSCFLKSYRGCVVNMAYIDKVDGPDFVMVTGDVVPMQKKSRKRLLKIYEQYRFEPFASG